MINFINQIDYLCDLPYELQLYILKKAGFVEIKIINSLLHREYLYENEMINKSKRYLYLVYECNLDCWASYNKDCICTSTKNIKKVIHQVDIVENDEAYKYSMQLIGKNIPTDILLYCNKATVHFNDPQDNIQGSYKTLYDITSFFLTPETRVVDDIDLPQLCDILYRCKFKNI